MSDDVLPKPPIEGLVEICVAAHRKGEPDRETEIVVADWCEEHGLLGVARAVRQEDANLRWSALAHLWRAIDQTFWFSPPNPNPNPNPNPSPNPKPVKATKTNKRTRK